MNLYLFLKRLNAKLSFYLLKFIARVISHKHYRLPYSNLDFTVHKLIFDSRKIRKNISESPIKNDLYFGHKIFTQVNDLRSYFNNFLDEEASRIFFQQKLLQITKSKYSATFFDIGSNYGTYSLPAVELNIHAVLVEPNPFICSCLRKTFHGKKVDIINKAIVDGAIAKRKSDISINLMPALSGSSSVSSQIVNEVTTRHEVFELDIPCFTITDVCSLANSSSDFGVFKIDIEGLELSLFEDDLISKINSRFENFVLMVEYVPDVMTKNDAGKLRTFLSEFPSLTLSDQNYRFNHDYLSSSFPSFKSLTTEAIKLNKIFSNMELRKGQKSVDGLRKVKYADVILFSGQKLAEELLEGLV